MKQILNMLVNDLALEMVSSQC